MNCHLKVDALYFNFGFKPINGCSTSIITSSFVLEPLLNVSEPVLVIPRSDLNSALPSKYIATLIGLSSDIIPSPSSYDIGAVALNVPRI